MPSHYDYYYYIHHTMTAYYIHFTSRQLPRVCFFKSFLLKVRDVAVDVDDKDDDDATTQSCQSTKLAAA